MGFQNFLNSEKGRLWSLQQPETKRMRINENSKNSRARNESYFHWLKTGNKDIFVVRYSNYSGLTGSLFTKYEIFAFEAEGFEAFGTCCFLRDAQKDTFSKSTKNIRGRKMYKKIHPNCGACDHVQFTLAHPIIRKSSISHTDVVIKKMSVKSFKLIIETPAHDFYSPHEY